MTHFTISIEEPAREEGRLSIVLRLLNRKVGPLSEELQARVGALEADALLSLANALLDFTEQADLVVWFDQQTGEPQPWYVSP